MSSSNEDFPGTGKKVGIIGIPLGYGAGAKGSELGATAIRLAKISGGSLISSIAELGYEVKDYGDVEIVKPDYVADAKDNPKYLNEVLPSYRNMAKGIKPILRNGELPVILGGDHSIALGTFSAIASFYHEQGKEIGLIWLDAHADINTHETSPSGNLHGMPLAALLGEGEPSMVNLEGYAPKLNPKYFAHVGARDLDNGEKRRIRKFGLQDNFFTMSDIDRRGMLDCIEDAVAVASKAPDGFAVTFDVDIIDP